MKKRQSDLHRLTEFGRLEKCLIRQSMKIETLSQNCILFFMDTALYSYYICNIFHVFIFFPLTFDL